MNFQSFSRVANWGQAVATVLIGTAAIASVVATALAGAGILPWPQVSLAYGGEIIPWFGMALQIGVTAFLVLLALFIPSAQRVLRLETSHRRFEIDMDDITRAYRAAHWADRKEMFDMHREFDAVRERYQHLKSQPELAEMDAELLTIAAQMSEQTRDLAEVYSEAKVARVRESLLQRRTDAMNLETRIQQTFAELRELKRLMQDVDAEEGKVAAKLQTLREEVAEIGAITPEFVRGTPHLKSVPAE